MIAIRQEIQDVIEGRVDARDNVLKHAPHTATVIGGDSWPHAYSRERAAFPLPYVRARKLWPAAGRIDNAYGDRNLLCVCAEVAAYTESEEVGVR
jgi:glycine dehydrogenase